MFLTKRILLASLLAGALAPAAFGFPKEVTVDLFRSKPASDRLCVQAPFRIIEPSSTIRICDPTYEIRAVGNQLELRTLSGGRIVLGARSLTLAATGRGITLKLRDASRTYAGTINIQSDGGRVSIHNRVPARDYVKSVVGSETDPAFQLEALKAQAVCTQTLLARYKPGDALTDTTEKQAYLGLTYNRPAVNQAVDAVWGQVLLFADVPASIYFHSTCAGGTSDGETYFELKRGSAPYLRATACTFCQASPFFKTKTSTIPRQRFNKSFGSALPEVAKVDAHKRPLEITIGTRKQSGFQFWSDVGSKLGWDKVPGTRFTISAGSSGAVDFRSTGAGHGIGLCQWGANGQAKLGKSYEEILGFYFPGALVQQLK